MIDHVVVDVEIQKTIEETPGGWNSTDILGVSVGCVWEYKTERMRIYGPGEIEELRERLMKAERISGFNIYKFDYPVIWGLPGRQRMSHLKDRTNDILLRIWAALGLNENEFTKMHGGWGLDLICRGTLGYGKIANGAIAPKWFQEGNWSKLANYCADDVALERDLTNFIDKYGFVYNEKLDRVLRLK